MDKIKINLSEQTFTKLNQDMLFFNANKDTVNKNGFLNTLLTNYFPLYDELASKHIDRYHKIVTQHVQNQKLAEEIINDLVASNEVFSYTKKTNLDSSISFKPNNHNQHILDIISSKYVNSQSISSFFRNMIEHYLSLPQYIREQIIHLDSYNMINEAIKANRKILISINNKKQEVIPYKIVTNKEEIYNYLVCLLVSKKGNTLTSIHLCKIDYVYLLPKTISLTKLELDKLENVASNSPQFPYSNDEPSVIELTDNGVRLYKNKYLNRPTPSKIEGNIYHFDCSYTQITLYFFPFGKDAKVLSPNKLKESFKREYLKAYESYN